MSVPAENVATPTEFVADKAIRLRSGVEIHNPSVAVVQGDHGIYRVTRQRIQGRWRYRCQCEFGSLGYGQHVFGTRMPCSHIKAADMVWTERSLAYRVDRFERELAELEKRDISLADKSTRGSEGLCSHRSTVGQALDSIPASTPGKVGGPAI